MAEEIRSFLEAIDSLLQNFAAHEGIQDAGYVLRVVNSRQNCITVLQDIVYNERITPGNRASIVELLVLLQLIVSYAHHSDGSINILFTLEVTNLPHHQPTSVALTRE